MSVFTFLTMKGSAYYINEYVLFMTGYICYHFMLLFDVCNL